MTAAITVPRFGGLLCEKLTPENTTCPGSDLVLSLRKMVPTEGRVQAPLFCLYLPVNVQLFQNLKLQKKKIPKDNLCSSAGGTDIFQGWEQMCPPPRPVPTQTASFHSFLLPSPRAGVSGRRRRRTRVEFGIRSSEAGRGPGSSSN